MSNSKENKTRVNFIYFKLDADSDKLCEIQGDNKINDCDMAIIRTASIDETEEMHPVIEYGKKFLNEKYPFGDWFYKQSKNDKHVFWKHESLLRQRQNQMQIPFKQAA